MKSKLSLSIILFCLFNTLHGQKTIAGSVIKQENNTPIAYVNIGIVGKNIGTVSDKDGKFNLLIEAQYMYDSLLFS